MSQTHSATRAIQDDGFIEIFSRTGAITLHDIEGSYLLTYI
jgi:hypothetical protein